MDVFDNLCNVIISNIKDKPKIIISSETRLVEDLNFDSLGMMKLMTNLEDEFDVFFPDVDFSQMKSVRDIELIITQRKLRCV